VVGGGGGELLTARRMGSVRPHLAVPSSRLVGGFIPWHAQVVLPRNKTTNSK